MKKDILSLGTMYIDINFKDYPLGDGLKLNHETVGTQYEIVPGGSALNLARMCTKLGLQTIFIGKAGGDELGALLTKLVKRENIYPAFIISSDVQTSISINFVDQKTNSIMTTGGTANSSISHQEILKQFEHHIQEVEYLYLGGCFKLKILLPHYEQIAKKAKNIGVKVIVDHGRVTHSVTEKDKENMKKLLKYTDYYLPSKDEFLSLWETSSIEEGLSNISSQTQATIIVKDAENGTISMQMGKITKSPAFFVKVINTVGAGDSFNAGFIRALKLNLSFEDVLRFANATAALKISQDDLPTVPQIQAFLKAKT